MPADNWAVWRKRGRRFGGTAEQREKGSFMGELLLIPVVAQVCISAAASAAAVFGL
jgi:hypothetical protein